MTQVRAGSAKSELLDYRSILPDAKPHQFTIFIFREFAAINRPNQRQLQWFTLQYHEGQLNFHTILTYEAAAHDQAVYVVSCSLTRLFVSTTVTTLQTLKRVKTCYFPCDPLFVRGATSPFALLLQGYSKQADTIRNFPQLHWMEAEMPRFSVCRVRTYGPQRLSNTPRLHSVIGNRPSRTPCSFVVQVAHPSHVGQHLYRMLSMANIQQATLKLKHNFVEPVFWTTLSKVRRLLLQLPNLQIVVLQITHGEPDLDTMEALLRFNRYLRILRTWLRSLYGPIKWTVLFHFHLFRRHVDEKAHEKLRELCATRCPQLKLPSLSVVQQVDLHSQISAKLDVIGKSPPALSPADRNLALFQALREQLYGAA